MKYFPVAMMLVFVVFVGTVSAAIWGQQASKPIPNFGYNTYSTSFSNHTSAVSFSNTDRAKLIFKHASTTVKPVNGTIHQTFDIKLYNGSGSPRLPTFWSTIVWAGGSSPSAITNGKTSWYFCDIIGVNTYECIIRGQSY